MKIRTEDGIELGEGDRAYDYYTMKPGVIDNLDNALRERVDKYHNALMQGSVEPWFDFKHDDGTYAILNGQRICSLEMAKQKGWYSE